MPRIFDNIDLQLLPILRETLKISYRADFCVGYFNLRGWRRIDDLIEQYVGSENACCRLLIGMQSLPSDEVHAAFTLSNGDGRIDNSSIVRFKKRMALEFSQVQNKLPTLRRYQVVLIDESHNLRNREGKRYRTIIEFIAANESKCILLSATPYNKSYLDLSAQLRLFVPEDQDLGLRPEALINELGGSSIGELKFIRKH